MKNESIMNKLSNDLCKAALSLSLSSLKKDIKECSVLLYEQKEPESLENLDLKALLKTMK